MQRNPLHAYMVACRIVREKMDKQKWYTYAALGLMLVVAILLVVDAFAARRKSEPVAVPSAPPAAPIGESAAS